METDEIPEGEYCKYYITRKSTYLMAIIIYLVQFTYMYITLDLNNGQINLFLSLFFLLFLFGSMTGKTIPEVIKPLAEAFDPRNEENDGFIMKSMRRMYRKIKSKEAELMGDKHER